MNRRFDVLDVMSSSLEVDNAVERLQLSTLVVLLSNLLYVSVLDNQALELCLNPFCFE